MQYFRHKPILRTRALGNIKVKLKENKMKFKMKFFGLAAAIVCCVLATSSCSKDDDNKIPRVQMLRFNPAKVEVTVNSTALVTVSGGTAPYTVKSGDTRIATVKSDKNKITIAGVKAGNAVITVTDKKGMNGKLTVTVTEKRNAGLDFDKKSVTVGVGKQETIAVKNGAAPYTVTVKDVKTATALVKDGKVMVKGVKAGTTTVTVTDKNKLSGMINVTVK